MSLESLTDKLKPKFLEAISKKGLKPCRIFLSASDMKSRALTRHASDSDPGAAFDHAVEQLTFALGTIEPTILRADWIIAQESMTWAEFNAEIGSVHRNFFYRGVALKPDFSIAFTASEMNANLIFYSDKNEMSRFNVVNGNDYCRRRFNVDFPLMTLESSSPVVVFDTAGVFVSDGGEPLTIDGTDHRPISHIDSESLNGLLRSGAQYLMRQVQEDGKFICGRRPYSNTQLTYYNSAHHFSALIAMTDVFDALESDKEQLRRAIVLAIDYAAKNFILYRPLPDGSQAAYIEDRNRNEIKLDSNGLALTAFSKITVLMHTPKYLPLMQALTRGLMTMQTADGSFVHVLSAESFALKEKFRSADFDGAAIVGLMMLYSITRDEKLLAVSKSAFERFIAADYWKYHSPQISMAVNELTKYEPRAEYFDFGIKNFVGHLKFVCHRETQYPTLMELMTAADAMLERMKTMPEMSEPLSKVPTEDFYAAMEARAKKMLDGYFYPETAMFFTQPENIVGSFFIRFQAFRVRIDDIAHFISGLYHRTRGMINRAA